VIVWIEHLKSEILQMLLVSKIEQFFQREIFLLSTDVAALREEALPLFLFLLVLVNPEHLHFEKSL